MASLIPDIGNVSTNTTGAMQNYLGTVKATNDAIERPADILNTYIKNNLTQKQIEADMALRKEANDRAAAELSMQQTERARINAERNATNTALQATINPDRYSASKIAGEQASIAQSLANLNPEERQIAEQQIKANYDPIVSKRGWLDMAVNANGVDIGRVFETKNKDYEMKAKTPGTPEYIAAQNAQFDLYKKEQEITHKNRLGEIGAQTAGQMAYLRAQQDAPREMVDPTSGKAYYVKPSEVGNYPSNLIAKDTLSAFLTNTREQSKIEQDRRKYEQEKVLKGKEALAESVSGLGNQDSTLSAIGDMNKLANDMGVTLTDADMSNAIKATTNGSGWTDRGKPDVDTSLLRDRLMQVISTQSKKPLEDVLKKYEGKGTKIPIDTSSKVTIPEPIKPSTEIFGDRNTREKELARKWAAGEGKSYVTDMWFPTDEDILNRYNQYNK